MNPIVLHAPHARRSLLVQVGPLTPAQPTIAPALRVPLSPRANHPGSQQERTVLLMCNSPGGRGDRPWRGQANFLPCRWADK